MQYFRLGILTSTERRICNRFLQYSFICFLYFSQKEHDFGHLEYEYFFKVLVGQKKICQITSENITLYVNLH